MANKVTTIVRSEKEVLDALGTEEYGAVDFRTVIPMPEELDADEIDWCTENWGTKWNAYETERTSDGEVRFKTAWEHPKPVITALSRKFPSADIVVKYADEALGKNLDHYRMKNGEVAEKYNLALDFASFVVHGMSYDDYSAY